MSHPLVSHSADLSRLQEEGYDLEIRANYLLIKHVPYATSSSEVAYGTLVSELTTTGTRTTTPGTHVAFFIGGIPCDHNGAALDNIIISKQPVQIADKLVAACTFSSKPTGGYANYYDKTTAYVGMLVGWAQAIDPQATARTHPPIRMTDEESVFRYLDAASSRAGVSHIAAKLQLPNVAIVGLGGTGSYILDFVAKTAVSEIHLYDGDRFYAHNAFRSPGAASADELDEIPFKVEYLHRQYDAIHRGVVPHPTYIDDTNVNELAMMSFVFLAVDSGPTRKLIVQTLEAADVPFIETGMGVDEANNSLAGILRVTASIPGHRKHVWDKHRISFSDLPKGDYDRNIQIADLNALNALLAVVKWKKLFGFYSDYVHDLTAAYVIARNRIVNDDRAS